jgi:hypothetical protein
MKESVKDVVQLASGLVFLEGILRICLQLHGKSLPGWGTNTLILLGSYLLCLLLQLCEMKENSFVKSPLFKNILTFCHAADGLCALLLGVGIYYQNIYLFGFGTVIMVKFGLLYVFNRMILAKTASLDDGMAIALQTTKSFLHHTASFLFLTQNPFEIIIVTLWRTISMTGHALLVLRNKVPSATISYWQWTLSYLRILILVGILFLLCMPSINNNIEYNNYWNVHALRNAMGHSAFGHIAYMAIRWMPLLQQGAVYVEHEKEEWVGLGDNLTARFHLLFIEGKYIPLTIELTLMVLLICIFFFLRWQVFWIEDWPLLLDIFHQQQTPLSSAASGTVTTVSLGKWLITS